MRLTRYRIPILVGFFGLTTLFALGVASAGPIQDIPADMAVALGTTPDIARMLLSSAILLSVGLIMAVSSRKVNMMATAIMLISTEGVLTGIGWLTPWLLLFSGLLVAALFAGKILSLIHI